MALLTDKYRPKKLDDVRGQPECIEYLKSFVAAPYPTALLFQGASGIGKTSAAYALAAELGVDFEAAELGGLHIIASGEQSADQVRETYGRMTTMPMSGSGWKVFIVNEVDRMSPAAETIWLDRLEQLPGHTLIIFSTNHPENLTDRFRDRCQVLQFAANHRDVGQAGVDLLADVWVKEAPSRPVDRAALAGIVKKSTALNGDFSFRRALMALQQLLAMPAKPAAAGAAGVAAAAVKPVVKTITCPACHKVWPAGMEFCEECGMTLAA